jgi:lysophospholipase L1-like esterase
MRVTGTELGSLATSGGNVVGAGCTGGEHASRGGRETSGDVMRRIALLFVLAFTLLVVAPTTSQAAAPALPSSMAAIGDSISQATDVCCWYGDHPANSWSTGSAGWDGVLSHYERIRASNPNISGHNYNDSVSGARMDDGPGQARRAVDQHARYVTILLGANDVCTSSPGTMTSVDTFRSNYQQTLQILFAGLPTRAHVFVASIPDIYRLWALYQDDSTAEFVWDTANICQSLLSPARSDADRQYVRDRNIDFNFVLQQECAKYLRCRFDNNAVFDYQFNRADVSKLDYFHPSLMGQAHLAGITWNASWWR